MTVLAAALSVATALGYYAGSWRCTASVHGGPPHRVDVRFAFDGPRIVRTAVTVPAAARSAAFWESQLTAWDATRRRFVQTSLDSGGSWSVSEASPLHDGLEIWSDVASNDGSRGREELQRLGPDRYVVRNYVHLHDRTPAALSDCRRR